MTRRQLQKRVNAGDSIDSQFDTLNENGNIRLKSNSRQVQHGTKDEMSVDLPYTKARRPTSALSNTPSFNADDGARLRKDLPNITLLIILYLLQGIPLGLALGTLPFMLKRQLSFAEMAIFSLCSWPYSLKLLWSPIVDSFYISSIRGRLSTKFRLWSSVQYWFGGRRKTWIIPLQLIVSAFLFWLARQQELLSSLIGNRSTSSSDALDASNVIDVHLLTGVFLLLVFFSATQDIAVDGWSLTLLHKENLRWASACQTIGLNTGYFLSFSGILYLVSTYNAKYSDPEMTVNMLSNYLAFWAVCFISVTLWLIVMKREDDSVDEAEGVSTLGMINAYKDVVSILKLPNMRILIVVLLNCKLPFIGAETLVPYRLIDMGVGEETLASIALFCFPLQLIVGWIGAKWSQERKHKGQQYSLVHRDSNIEGVDAPQDSDDTGEEGQDLMPGEGRLRPWLYSYYIRLLLVFYGMALVYLSKYGLTKVDGDTSTAHLENWFYGMIVFGSIAGTVVSTIQFVSIGSFFATISDPLIGGTYLTLLNTLSNFGGTWPSFFVLRAVDLFTSSTCIQSVDIDGASGNSTTSSSITDFSLLNCNNKEAKNLCINAGGECNYGMDGFYVVNFVCIVLGVMLFVAFIRSHIRMLEITPIERWRVYNGKK
ncbi:hypothetical protein MP228_008568 [Amoeboaphelidium protococcarum]|nr:hypothetical protein MP228_008568 [Amoeboaphelidium protococcarum]